MRSKKVSEERNEIGLNNNCEFSIDPVTAIEQSKCPSYGSGECNENCYACVDEQCKQMERLGLI